MHAWGPGDRADRRLGLRHSWQRRLDAHHDPGAATAANTIATACRRHQRFVSAAPVSLACLELDNSKV